MASKTRTTTIHGATVKQVDFSGNWYTTVASRVQIAQQVNPESVRVRGCGFHVVSHSILPVADRWAFTCVVEYPVHSGIYTCGSDFIDVKDATGLAKAETSAIGRALSMHGIDIEGGIASAEEMERVAGAATQSTEDAYLPPAKQEAIVEDAWQQQKDRALKWGLTEEEFAAAKKTKYRTVAAMAAALDALEEQRWEQMRMRANEVGMTVQEYEFHLTETGGDYQEMQALVEAFGQRSLRMLKGGKAGVH